MEPQHRRFLYIGGFVLPNHNAAAQRVLANGLALKALGHEVFFLNFSENAPQFHITDYFGFVCHEYPKCSMYKKVIDIAPVIRAIKDEKITDIIAYNYSALGFVQLLRYAKRHHIRIFSDVTEWYTPQGNTVFRLIKTIDTEWRMRVLHFKTQGVIAISEYLYQYYKNRVNTVRIPPLVDANDEKWMKCCCTKQRLHTTFIYSGNPSAQKERLRSIIAAIEQLPQDIIVTLKIVGITKGQYEMMYGISYHGIRTEFLGRMPHTQAVQELKNADWSIIIRDNNRVVKAGFPTKLVESITCGTPCDCKPV